MSKRIGILGGSFNPAHDGHRHLSLIALKRLRLDEVWWMVSPQNPLKDSARMAPFETRLAMAKRVAGHRRIRVTDIEKKLNTRYTVDTLVALKKRHRGDRLVWLMGADNLIGMRRWKNWRKIFAMAPVAIIGRPTYSLRALAGLVATRFRRARLDLRDCAGLAYRSPPAWVFLFVREHPASATEIRAQQKRKRD